MKKEMKNQTFAMILIVLMSICFLGTTINTKVLKNNNWISVVNIHGESMNPTIKHGQKVFAMQSKNLESGDIVVANVPSEGSQIKAIKRIIGMPGDTVEIKDAKVYLNGELLDEDYVKEGSHDTFDFKTILNDDEYWIMGDNRNISQDSRNFGPVKSNDIVYEYKFTVIK